MSETTPNLQLLKRIIDMSESEFFSKITKKFVKGELNKEKYFDLLEARRAIKIGLTTFEEYCKHKFQTKLYEETISSGEALSSPEGR